MVFDISISSRYGSFRVCNRIDQIPYILEKQWRKDTDDFYPFPHGLKEFPADWETWGKSAGYKRNIELGQYCDSAIIIWDGKSKGTKHMLDILDEYNKPYILYKVV